MRTLEKAVDMAVARANADFLDSPEAIESARQLGKLYARVFEAQDRGFVQKPYPEETLEQFCERAERS